MAENNFEGAGNVKISEEVVGIIAGMAAGEIKGVCGMANSIAGGIYELIGKKNLSKGVKADINEDRVVIDIYLIVEYGCKIPEVAWAIQEKVKGQVETMTGLSVQGVNIHIQGVSFERDIPEKEEPEDEE